MTLFAYFENRYFLNKNCFGLLRATFGKLFGYFQQQQQQKNSSITSNKLSKFIVPSFDRNSKLKKTRKLKNNSFQLFILSNKAQNLFLQKRPKCELAFEIEIFCSEDGNLGLVVIEEDIVQQVVSLNPITGYWMNIFTLICCKVCAERPKITTMRPRMAPMEQ